MDMLIRLWGRKETGLGGCRLKEGSWHLRATKGMRCGKGLAPSCSLWALSPLVALVLGVTGEAGK